MKEILLQNFIDIVKEAEIKVGYAPMAFSMYYPLESLNRMIDASLSEKEMIELIQSLSGSVLGEVQVKLDNGRLCITIPKEGVRYIHENVENKFLEDFIQTIKKVPCTLDDVKEVFSKYSNNYICKEALIDDEEQNVIYFKDGNPNNNIYIIHFDFGMPEYHRFTRNEFKKFDFADLVD